MAPGWAGNVDMRVDVGVTAGQREAVKAAMEILVEEDRSRGVDPAATIRCARCRGTRSLIGSVDYGGTRFCHECATRFELARVAGRARTGAEFAAGARHN